MIDTQAIQTILAGAEAKISDRTAGPEDRVLYMIATWADRANDRLARTRKNIADQLSAGHMVHSSTLENLVLMQQEAKALDQMARTVFSNENLAEGLKRYHEDGMERLLGGHGSSTSMIANAEYAAEEDGLRAGLKLALQAMQMLQG